MSELDHLEGESNDNKFWHRKQCSNRVFIGPWNLKPLPSPLAEESQFSINNIESTNPNTKLLNKDISSDGSQVFDSLNKSSGSASQRKQSNEQAVTTSSIVSPSVTPSSNGTSFVTATSGSNPAAFHSSGVLEQMISGNDDDDDEEVDYGFPNKSKDILLSLSSSFPNKKTTATENDISNTTDTDTESIRTIRPSDTIDSKGKSPMDSGKKTTTDNKRKKKKKTQHLARNSSKKSGTLHWKKSGSRSITRTTSNNTTDGIHLPAQPNKPIKREPILCMRSVTGCNGSEPTQYKAAKEARYDLLTEKWTQLELVLTNTYISTYSSSRMFWPKQWLEHRIYLSGPRKPKKLELFLLSSLDYTFCLRHQSNSLHSPTMITFTFKAQSFLKCQEWYMQLYDLLSEESKKQCPKYCEVYIPTLDLSVNLPLEHNNDATMDQVKEAVIATLEQEQDVGRLVLENDGMKRFLSLDQLGLCWSTRDRAEWVYWSHASSNKNQRIDRVICPQSIEKTHRLELRRMEHTDHTIILNDDFVLKEPPPVEGFLTCMTDFFGRSFANTRLFKPKMRYFASFDKYLFYTPAAKVEEPDMACFFDEDLIHQHQDSNTTLHGFVSALSPYQPGCDGQIEAGEIRRRMRLMTEAKGVIDLTEVSYVRRTFENSALSTEEESNQSSNVTLGKKSSRVPIIQHQDRIPNHRALRSSFHPKSRKNPSLELVMENGLQIKFEAYSSDTVDLWVSYLAQIIVYWKARAEAEKEAHSYNGLVNNPIIMKTDVKTTKDKLIIDNNAKTEDGCVHRIKEKEYADTRIWSFCLYEQCRDIVKSGVLYYKPDNRGAYSQKMFILTASGWMLYFDTFNRSDPDRISCNHNQKGAIDIAGCYFYSGADCSKQKKGSNRDINESRKSARIYRNGLTTYDNTLSCIFSIWKPKLRKYFSASRQRLRVYRHDNRLNPTGHTWTLLAQSRREKEEWVCALNTVTEHMIRCDKR